MIVFDFSCICGCQFEGWFDNRADCERQYSENLILCPKCSGSDIHKILSAVTIKSSTEQSSGTLEELALTKEEMATAILRSLQNYIVENFEDVGVNLAEKSLKIYYGVDEVRNIRGVATSDEEKMLKKEGIELLKIPLPADKDKLN
ncbi:MAG: DUF1178 family protein [Proteobacteria bacterium]|nr:DUF1178 family protein [Pseudomonadota bacterium]MBU1715924.1 DUF1178 family protein [Pseudomonadota bacterium]